MARGYAATQKAHDGSTLFVRRSMELPGTCLPFLPRSRGRSMRFFRTSWLVVCVIVAVAVLTLALVRSRKAMHPDSAKPKTPIACRVAIERDGLGSIELRVTAP